MDTLVPIKNSVICYHNVSHPGNQQPQNLPYHRHNAYEIYLFLGGNANLYIEHSCFHLIPGDLFLISPEQLHRSECLDSQRYDRIVLNLREEKLNKLSSSRTDLSSCFHMNSPEYATHSHLTGEYMSHFRSLIDEVQYSLGQNDYGSDILSDAFLSQILVFINKRFSNHTSQVDRNIMPELVRQTMEFISQNLTEPLTLSLLSHQFHLSGAYISSQFKSSTGLTLRTYILDQRINSAQKLLREGCNVSEACFQSGFTDYSNFIRSFTKHTGISPGKYSKHYDMTEH